jgi:hypothetical protein
MKVMFVLLNVDTCNFPHSDFKIWVTKFEQIVWENTESTGAAQIRDIKTKQISYHKKKIQPSENNSRANTLRNKREALAGEF